ncbi:helicase-exonuclease AddAB, AddB subunit [Weissella viridescens]|uniref:Helicase-exonuclease AddAB, AddB subunit n=1 Tax=Weissella viridescens TaxID=1629 RepID=A0A380P6Q3_WEIVI|nr:helicase-exonuclease AddAB, AddB subunit [Weissella viridescens]
MYGFEYKKSGDALKSGHETYSDDELNTLIDYNRYMIQHIAERILQGSFPLQPFRDKQATGLQHSDYLPVMFFDAMLGNKYHDISQLPSDRNGALEAMHRKMTEPDSTEEDNQ